MFSRWHPSVLLVAAAIGCSASSTLEYTDHSQDPERFARLVKQTVVEVVADARKSIEPYDEIRLIAQSVDGDNKPIGPYGDVYDRLRSLADELADACELADGPTADMNRKLDELLAIADELPGEFQPVEEPRL